MHLEHPQQYSSRLGQLSTQFSTCELSQRKTSKEHVSLKGELHTSLQHYFSLQQANNEAIVF
jgi:hypothetical protein